MSKQENPQPILKSLVWQQFPFTMPYGLQIMYEKSTICATCTFHIQQQTHTHSETHRPALQNTSLNPKALLFNINPSASSPCTTASSLSDLLFSPLFQRSGFGHSVRVLKPKNQTASEQYFRNKVYLCYMRKKASV